MSISRRVACTVALRFFPRQGAAAAGEPPPECFQPRSGNGPRSSLLFLLKFLKVITPWHRSLPPKAPAHVRVPRVSCFRQFVLHQSRSCKGAWCGWRPRLKVQALLGAASSEHRRQPSICTQGMKFPHRETFLSSNMKSASKGGKKSGTERPMIFAMQFSNSEHRHVCLRTCFE